MTTPHREAGGPSRTAITELLTDWSAGDPAALEALLPLVVEELRSIAGRLMRGERRSHTLDPTGLVNELYLHLEGRHSVTWESSRQFFSFAATAMRRILVDYARHRDALKRGGGTEPDSLDAAAAVAVPLPAGCDWPGLDLLALNEALDRLARLDRRQREIVELRFFAGLSVEEVARVLEVSPATVFRDWACAKAWLFHQLKDGAGTHERDAGIAEGDGGSPKQ